jgi:hypothetical protein
VNRLKMPTILKHGNPNGQKPEKMKLENPQNRNENSQDQFKIGPYPLV